MPIRPRALVVTALAGALLAAGGAVADRPSTATPSRQRPGPAILYAPPADAPQLENRPGSGWHATPLLISGAEGYVQGEFLSQGYLYDDHGGAGLVDGNDQLLSKFT